jgi:hypothetical protein
MRISVTNAGPEQATLHVLPTAWFRNTWSWDHDAPRSVLAASADDTVTIGHPFLGELELTAGGGPGGTRPVPLFCENETNTQRLYELTWFDWARADYGLLDFTRRVIALRKAHPVFRRRRFRAGTEAADRSWSCAARARVRDPCLK